MPAGERVDDLIECLECGRSFRSLAGHTVAQHGMTVQEYKTEHGLPLHVPLDGSDTSARRREARVRVLEHDPEHVRRLSSLRKTGHLDVPAPRTPQSESGPAAESIEQFWAVRLASCGWESWQDAADWAIETNAGWAAVAERLGVTENPVLVHAKEAGVTLPQVLSTSQLEVLERARHHVANRGSLADPGDLHDFLRITRNRLRRGESSRIFAALDQIDPAWRTPAPKAPAPLCIEDGCDRARVAKGRCRRHYDRYRDQRERDAVTTERDRVQCRECGQWFQRLGQHVSRIHQMSPDEYRSRHDLPAGAMSAPRSDRPTEGDEAAWWSEALAAAGWGSWEDAVAWAMAENEGWVGIARRLGRTRRDTAAAGKAAGVHLPPPLTELQVKMLHHARQVFERTGSLRDGATGHFARWLTNTRRDRRRHSGTARVYAELDRIDPDWLTRGGAETSPTSVHGARRPR